MAGVWTPWTRHWYIGVRTCAMTDIPLSCCRLSPVGRTNALLTISVMSEFASHAPTVAAVWPSVKTCPGSVRSTASVHAGRVRVECRMFCAAAPCRPNRFHYMDFFAARVSEKLRWVRAGLRQSPCGSGRARVMEFSFNAADIAATS